ncbi:shikimate kinase [Runella slithyformis]|uniref:Shikimate kinase n=1 Tax=Runella slithyformis (strain ATCC 29530 / DSM 19594 / LMG 11500 / NCIMB 11436 / LSU 4) TaxID=761193 RepID=A0A7U3ZQW6_RUNSL|nr:shikimate kinase [Runella slithyformis]AEI51709.1 Shikimate kinase [Runella slithyformis DSM 19594]
MKNIFLVGLPSSGKTTLGKQLARQLRYRFVDTDVLIVKEEGMSINAIFAQKGEPYFREAEARILRAIRPDSKLIVATGGGVPYFHDNMAYIKENGISVFLDVAPEEIVDRIQRHSSNDRPTYQKQDTQLLENLQQRYRDRFPFYSQADFTLKGESLNIRQLLNVLQEVVTV